MIENKEIVAFTCGLLPDPSPLVDLAYNMLITENIHTPLISIVASLYLNCPILKHEDAYYILDF